MRKLIYFEFRKNFLKKSIISVVLIFSVLSIVKIYNTYTENSLLSEKHNPLWKDLYWEMYEEYEGTITEEKVEKLMSIYRPLENQTADRTISGTLDTINTYTGNIYNDYYFLSWNFVTPMEYAYMYKWNSNDIMTSASENVTFFESVGNQYEYRKNVIIEELFKDRNISEFSYTEMFQYYIHYDFSTFLILLICMYGLMNVFVSEKQTEMEILLLTTKSGGTKTIFAKIISSTIFVGIVCGWFFLIDFISFLLVFNTMEAVSSPLYAIENFSNSSINVSLGQYVFISEIVKILGILVLSLLFLLISSFFNNTLFPFISSFVAMFGLVYIQEFQMGSGHILLKTINPFVLVVNRELFRKIEFVNIFSFPVLSFIPALLFAVVWGGLCILGIIVWHRKNTVGRKGVR